MHEPLDDYKPIRVPVYVKPVAIDVIAFVVLVVFTIVGVSRAVAITPDLTAIGFAEIMEFCLWFGVGLSVSGMLASCAVLVRLVTSVREGFARLERFQYEQRIEFARDRESAPGRATPDSDAASSAVGAAQWQELIMLMRDVRDNALLSEPQRELKRDRLMSDDVQQMRQAVQALIDGHDFNQARAMADGLAAKYPESPEASDLVTEIETARDKRESADIRESAKQIDDLVSISAWERARELAEQLRARHPDAEASRLLVARIEREFTVFQDEQRQRMYAEVQRYASRKRWAEALAAAKTFMERFPNCQETEMLRVETPTLAANAEIARRQQLEAEIMELAKHGRYMEAAELSRRVIERYPASPQAEVLKTQLARLEELANDPNAPPARVRIE